MAATCKAKIWLPYLKHVRGGKGRLSRNILREVCSYLLPFTMAAVWGNTAFLYDLESMHFSTYRLSVRFNDATRFIETDRNTLLCVGGYNSTAVYSLDLLSFQLTPLPSLSNTRSYSGLAKVKTRFYMFGGRTNNLSLSSCEKMQLSDQRWTRIPSMHFPRAHFTPCHFRSLLYLACAPIRPVETFNAESEIFTSLSVLLPSLRPDNSSVAFIANGELCLLTNAKQMARWEIDTKRKFRISGSNHTCDSNQPPLILGSLVFIVCRNEVQKFSLKTYSFLN